MITVSHTMLFKADVTENILVGLPCYLEQLTKNEWSPFHTYLGTLQPGKRVSITIVMQSEGED